MTGDLRPCPFCGREPSSRTFEHGDRDGSVWVCRVRCPWCGATIEASDPYAGADEVEEEAIDRWNTRSVDVDRVRKVGDAMMRVGNENRALSARQVRVVGGIILDALLGGGGSRG